jgi:hypothetical protein
VTSPSSRIEQISPGRSATWYQRNWKWFVPALILAAILVIVLFLGGLLWFLESAVHGAFAYDVAVKTASVSPQVKEALGSPLQVGWLTTGGFNYSGPEADVQISIPVSGPKGRGHISVVAKKRANHWSFESFEVDVKGQDPIQLNVPDGTTDARPDSSKGPP